MTSARRWGEHLKARAADLWSLAVLSAVTVAAFLIIDQSRVQAMHRAEEQRHMLAVEMQELKSVCLKAGR